MRLGIAIGSNDIHLIPFLNRLINKKKYLDYVELYVQPNIQAFEMLAWRTLDTDFILHAPHGPHSEYRKRYIDIAKTTAKILKTPFIVFDPGERNAEEVIESDTMTLPEVMPYETTFGTKGLLSLPEEVTENNFCLDLAHAVITARQIRYNEIDMVKDFIRKDPKHYHLTDVRGTKDHVLLGEGDMELNLILELLPDNATITIETDHILKQREINITHDISVFRYIWKSLQQ